MARILVADDEPDVRTIITERLRMAGHEVLCVSNGAKAILKAEDDPVDLAILDVRMPGCDGYAVCYVIKNSPKCSKTAVLLMSAFSEEKAKWQLSKADGFLAKPFETSQLMGEVERLLKAGGQ